VQDVRAVEEIEHGRPRSPLPTPPAGNHLGILRLGLGGAEGEEREPVGPGLEGADRILADADSVPFVQLVDVVVQLHASGARDDDVDLFLLVVVVPVGKPGVGREPLEAQAEPLAVERLAGEAGLDVRRETELLGRVVDIRQEVLDRVVAQAADSRRAPLSPGRAGLAAAVRGNRRARTPPLT